MHRGGRRRRCRVQPTTPPPGHDRELTPTQREAGPFPRLGTLGPSLWHSCSLTTRVSWSRVFLLVCSGEVTTRAVPKETAPGRCRHGAPLPVLSVLVTVSRSESGTNSYQGFKFGRIYKSYRGWSGQRQENLHCPSQPRCAVLAPRESRRAHSAALLFLDMEKCR